MLTEYSDEFDTLGRLVGIFIVAPLMYNAGVTGATDGLITAAYVMYTRQASYIMVN